MGKSMEYYYANREAILEKRRKRRQENLAEVRRYHRAYYLKHRPGPKTREKAVALLGSQCVRCGIDDVRVLQIDHRNGGGAQEHRRIGSTGIARRVLKHPELYQILCANCNWIKRYERNENPQRLDEEPLSTNEGEGKVRPLAKAIGS